MKKTYTKKQIREAIAYWKKQLKESGLPPGPMESRHMRTSTLRLTRLTATPTGGLTTAAYSCGMKRPTYLNLRSSTSWSLTTGREPACSI